MDSFKQLPTMWVKLDLNLNLICEGADRSIPFTDGRYYYIAKVHYKTGVNGERQYLLSSLDVMPEVLRVREDPRQPGMECLSQRIVYGEHIPLSNTH